jgi:hypothetical protein
MPEISDDRGIGGMTYNHDGKEHELRIESFEDERNLQEEITLFYRLDRC